MQTLQAIKKRRSFRQFSARSVPTNLIKKIIDAGRLAPSARNIQPWEFIAVTKKPTLKNIADLAEDNGRFIADSACCIAVFCRDTKYYLEDGCAATENILLTAADLGVAGCWVAGDKKYYSENVRGLLKVPEDFKLISLIPLGYSLAAPRQIPKRPVKEVLHWEKF